MANLRGFRSVLPRGTIVVLLKNKMKIKPGIHKLAIRRDQGNFRYVFTFATCEEKGYYRVASVGQLSLYCGLSYHMQGNSYAMLSHGIPWNTSLVNCIFWVAHPTKGLCVC